MKKNILDQYNKKYKEIIIPYTYEKLKEIKIEADRLYKDKLISLRAKELITKTIAEKNNHSVIIGAWSLFLLLEGMDLKETRNLTHTLTCNVFLFDLLDDLVDDWKISRKDTLKYLYSVVLLDAFCPKDKKKFFKSQPTNDKSLKEIYSFLSYLVKESSFDKYCLSKETFLKDLSWKEINCCARSQFILALSKKDRKKEITDFLREEYARNDVKKIKLPINRIESFLLVSGTPISALFLKTLQVVNNRKFIITKKDIFAVRDFLLTIKTINVVGDQIKDDYFDRQMNGWSYAKELNVDIFWLKKMIFKMWADLRKNNEEVKFVLIHLFNYQQDRVLIIV